MNDDTPRQPDQRLALHLDNGTELRFTGHLFAGGSWYDEESGVLTRQKLYATPSGEHVYSIVSGRGPVRSRRAYRVALHGDACAISDGSTRMTLDLETLMFAVRALAGLDQDDAALDMVEETLRAANC